MTAAATDSIQPYADSHVETACSHCGLPVPPGRVDAEELQFCCDGCRTVYAVLHDCGLEDYYDLRARSGGEGAPARTTSKAYSELDDPAFEKLYVTVLEDGSCRAELLLEGVHCAACVWLVERLPRLVDGVISVRLDLGKSLVQVRWDPTRVALSRIGKQLDALGYPPHPASRAESDELTRREDRALLMRLAIAGAAAGNTMLMAAALYSGDFQGMAKEHVSLFRWGSFAVTLPAVFYSASPFFRSAWGSLKARAPHMDLPISIGILAGFSWGTFNTFSANGEVYFDSVTALIFLLLIGRWVQRRQQRKAARAAELLHALTPSTAKLIEGELTREVPLEVVMPGARVVVGSGERVPVDGVVAQGESSLDTSWLNGESRPEMVEPGSPVHAGSVNLSRRLVIEVVQTGADTRVGQLMQQVESAARRRAPIVLLANRLSGIFVLAVISLAAATLMLWWGSGPQAAVEHAVALLIVTCPCALGLATPLAIGAALGRAARRGLLVKGGDVLERFGVEAGSTQKPLVVFDKTGTLTEGRMQLLAWHGDPESQTLARAVEAHSRHPIAQALVNGLPSEDSLLVDADSITEQLGGGIGGRVAGRSVMVGSPRFLQENGIDLPADLEAHVEAESRQGHTAIAIAVDGAGVAVAALGDPLRSEARATLDQLRAAGFEVALLSGDHPGVVSAVAQKLGRFAWARGGVTPEKKLETVEELSQGRTVVMVGDGVNDAAALAAASVGVAVQGGAEASLQAADVFSTQPGLAPLLHLVRGARATLRTVRYALAFSLLYNLVGATLALTGLISPLAAAVLMPLSSLTVVTLAYRSRSFR